MFPTEVQIPHASALHSFERRLPWTICCIAPKRKRRARPVHTESVAWAIRRCRARENGFNPWQRLQDPGFWCPCSYLYTAFPTEKRGEDTASPLLAARRIPQTLQAVVCIHRTTGVMHTPPDTCGVLAEELGVRAIAQFGDNPTFDRWQLQAQLNLTQERERYSQDDMLGVTFHPGRPTLEGQAIRGIGPLCDGDKTHVRPELSSNRLCQTCGERIAPRTYVEALVRLAKEAKSLGGFEIDEPE